ncbi:transmembrane protein, putative (macronuclear) [Tetrahymena thermophila SB210]|uniref:Transmembrane protein, putative n=1 Tax=Tetrahymena thermophila (strain SB210) TaxID=312017 RepID=Q23YB4_TETTS|nr:transmembrane protein, putative [Tetrahymena thermophila SB210]EAS01550.2 transmembrane protein, putative [Tetrahymena thermophila SB210]|eukprot:XP_001021795.2 transmembrane protein, putative [Tetrahymena thermophila SB210]
MIINSEDGKERKIHQLYKESAKTLFKYLYAIFILFIIYAIMALVSSSILKNQYNFNNDLQLMIIILVSASFFFKILSFYLLTKKSLTNIIFFSLYLILLPTHIAPIVQLISFIYGSFHKYCGYLFRYQGRYPTSLIIFNLENYYPSCDEMESNGSLLNQLKYNSLKVIINGCRTYQAKDSCYQFDTLQIDNWNNMFVVQIVSFSIAVIWIFSTSVLLLLLKAKHIQATQKYDLEIKNNLLNQSNQNQVFSNQLENQQISYSYSNYQIHTIPATNTQNPLQVPLQTQDYTIGVPINS